MKAKCFFCGSELHVSQSDMMADIDPAYDGDGVALIRKYVCPTCGREYEVCDPMKSDREGEYKEYWNE